MFAHAPDETKLYVYGEQETIRLAEPDIHRLSQAYVAEIGNLVLDYSPEMKRKVSRYYSLDGDILYLLYGHDSLLAKGTSLEPIKQYLEANSAAK